MGCIFGELLGGKPMLPGSSTLSQFNKVLEVTEKPSKEDIESIKSELFEIMLENVFVNRTKSLKTSYPKANEDELDLLSKLLEFYPNKRIDENTLEHNYVKEFHSQYSDTEITCDKPIYAPIYYNIKYSAKEYRKKII